MEGRLLLKNCGVLRSGGQVTRAQAVVVEGRQIIRVAPDAEVPALPGDWVVSCDGRLVMPGLADCHASLLAALEGRGQPTPSEAGAIAAHALATGLRAGITTHLEHLAAPHAVEPILQAQAAAAERLGARLHAAHASSTVAVGAGSARAASLWSGVTRWEQLFDGPAQRLATIWGGRFGAVASGYAADLVVLDAVEAGATVRWERLALAPVAWTIVDGRVAVREGQLLGASFTQLAADAARAVESAWARV